MLTTVEIELIGYVGKNPIFPKPNEYPNFVTFPVGVSRTWKDKEGKEAEGAVQELLWVADRFQAEALY